MTGELTAPYTEHNCLDSLILRSGYNELGTGEERWEEWLECGACHKTYSQEDADKMWDDEAPGLDLEDRLQEADDALGVC